MAAHLNYHHHVFPNAPQETSRFAYDEAAGLDAQLGADGLLAFKIKYQ